MSEDLPRNARKRTVNPKLTDQDNISDMAIKRRRIEELEANKTRDLETSTTTVVETEPVSAQSNRQSSVIPRTSILDDDAIYNTDTEEAGPSAKDTASDNDSVQEVEGPVKKASTSQYTDEELLEKMMREWRSPIYAFFNAAVTISNVNGRVVHEFMCNAQHCKGKGADPRVVRRYTDTSDSKSTGNLRRHAKVCWGEENVSKADETKDVELARKALKNAVVRDGSITAHFERSGSKGKPSYSIRTQTKAEIRMEIVKWVSENKRPFSIVRDESFLALMKTGRPGHYVPSPNTVARDVKHVYRETHKRLAKMLRDYPGRLSFATDAWTSPNNIAFVAVTVHLVQDGRPLAFLLDIVEVARSHSGINLTKAFAAILDDFGIGHKILGITCDNASSNDAMIDELAHLVDTFPGAKHRVRCFAHILNLVVRRILSQFDDPKTDMDEGMMGALELEDDLEMDDGSEDELIVVGGLDTLINKGDDGTGNGREAMSVEEVTQLEETVRPVRVVLVKLRKASFAIKNSSTLILPRWYELISEAAATPRSSNDKTPALAKRLMPRDVKTRWNTTYDMLTFAWTYRDIYNNITSQRDMRQKLREMELDEEEWDAVGDLKRLFKIFKDATLFFSRSTPSLAKVIPAMDHIDEHLAGSSINNTYCLAVRAAIAMGKTHLNEYYNKTDDSELYRIAMVLHPAHKLSYFKAAKWEAEWIMAAEAVVRSVFDDIYADIDVEMAWSKPMSNTQTNPDSTNIFDNLPLLATQQTVHVEDELTRYLQTPAEMAVQDPLMWWVEKQAVYPRLSRMALDYLSIPATSVDVERVFSQGRILLSHIRNRLTAQSTRALLCLGTWSKAGLVKIEDMQSAAGLAEV